MSDLRVGAAVLAVAFSFGLSISLPPAFAAPNNEAHDTLSPFRSDDELLRYLKRVRPKRPPMASYDAMTAGGLAEPTPPPPPPPPAPASAPAADTTAAPAPAQSDKITNTQEANVDEGDIVKARGDLLVILRRGRLFTVSTKHGELRPIDHINAYPPGVDPSADWYDEMLIAGNRVIVIGYSYGRGGT